MAAPANYTLHIQPTYVYFQPESVSKSWKSSKAFQDNQKNLKKNSHEGEVSAKAAKKIKNAVNWLVLGAKKKRVYSKQAEKTWFFKIALITLTLPTTEHELTDKEIKQKVFHPWLQYMRAKYGLRNYIWKAEVQKNGNLHFHITTDIFIHHKHLRHSWNKQLDRTGMLDEFEAKHSHRNPNSTDVKCVRNVKNLAAYLAKYMAKSEKGKRAVQGRLWGCNYELSNARKVTYEATGLTDEVMREIHNNKEYKEIEVDVGRLYVIDANKFKENLPREIEKKVENKIFEIQNDIEVAPPITHILD